jgi:hypothetical protein
VAVSVIGAVVVLVLVVLAARDHIHTARPLRSFAGYWTWHSDGVRISADGHGDAAWRVYKWCRDDPTPPCDQSTNEGIVSGGRATFVLTSAKGGTAEGRVTSSTDPATVPVGHLAIRLAPGNHLAFPGLGGGPLCGPRAHSDCGA